MATTPDAVAVLIAAKDAAHTIGRAVRSALAQPEAAEVIVVDDGSADRTATAARDCDDGTGRLAVLVLPENLGPAAARNLALQRATAAHVCVLDADDVMQAGRLGRLLAFAGDEWDMVADDLLIAGENSADGPYRTLCDEAGELPRALSLEAFVRGNLEDARRQRGELGYLKPLIRRGFLTEHALRYDPALRLGEDYALYAEALARGARMRLVPACGYVAIAHPNSLSHRHTAEDLGRLLEADDRLLARPGLSPGERHAIAAHRAGIARKYWYRRMLNAKAARQPLAALACLLKTPGTTSYILRQTLHARLGRATLPR